MTNANPAASQSFRSRFEARMFARDLAVMVRLSDERKRENAAARARCKANVELVELLTSEAARRGRSLDWNEYFRNIGIAD